MYPLISIIVPVYNGAEYLPCCLVSILAQTYQEYEVILINDGSTDDTPDICHSFAYKDDRIKYFEQNNQGLAATRNIGIRKAKGTYISFVDADDWIEPTYLAYLFELMKNTNYGISACNHWIWRNLKPRPRFVISDSQSILTPQETFLNILYDRYPDVSAWGKLYQREILKGIQYPEGCLFEDTYRIADVLLASGGIIYGSKPQYHYRISSQSLSRGKFGIDKLDYLYAVNHMSEVIASHYDGLEKGIARCKMHALLSTRRHLIGCSSAETDIRDSLEKQIRAGSAVILRDRQAPCRDKTGIVSVLLGSKVYDAFWKVYEGIRRK